eukprot:scaffold10915_cov141-Amphora_coffeaeformis.AAC.1
MANGMAVAVGLPCPQSIFGTVDRLYIQGSLLGTTDIIGVCVPAGVSRGSPHLFRTSTVEVSERQSSSFMLDDLSSRPSCC